MLKAKKRSDSGQTGKLATSDETAISALLKALKGNNLKIYELHCRINHSVKLSGDIVGVTGTPSTLLIGSNLGLITLTLCEPVYSKVFISFCIKL